MKRLFVLAMTVALVLPACVSCQKATKEWAKCYSYTVEELVGTYSFSNVEGAFDGLEEIEETHYSSLCADAEIEIDPLSGQSIRFRIECPQAEFAKTFSGKPSKMENDFRISMSTGYSYVGGKLQAFNLMAYVYKNAAQQVRLHGFASSDTYEVETSAIDASLNDTIKTNSHTYYFDVIKN